MLKELREKNGLSKTFVAKKLDIHRDTVRSFEEGETELRVSWLVTLSELYHISEEKLLKEYLSERRNTDE